MILWREGRAAPVIQCDACERDIEDVHLAMYAFDQAERMEGAHSRVYFVHKGDCWQAVNKRLKLIGDMELSALLDFLRHNLRLDMRASAEAAHIMGAEDCSYENPDLNPGDEREISP